MASVLPPETPELETTSRKAKLKRTLPKYHGPLPVGVCDIEVPVPHETFGTFIHKHMKGKSPAGLSLDTALFSIFYPTTDEPSRKKVVWFPNPWQTVDGFIRMARKSPNLFYRSIAYPVAGVAIYGTTFPAKPNTPLREPPTPEHKWPLVIFSHGVGTSRLMYSSFCGELASHGYIVCAIEHRDGTSPSSVIVSEDGKAKTLHWLQWSDLHWPDLPEHGQPENDTILRHSQLKLRVREIFHTIEAMKRIARGERLTVTSKRNPPIDWSLWKDKIGIDKPIMTGHSLGGSAAILAASDDSFDFGGIVAFDPAIHRLEPWDCSIPPPLLVVNSEEYTKSSDFLRLETLLKHAQQLAGVFSIAGSTHPAISDVFLIIPNVVSRMTGLSTKATRVLSLSMRATLCFLYAGGGTGKMSGEDVEQFVGMVAANTTVEGQGNFKPISSGTFVRHVLDPKKVVTGAEIEEAEPSAPMT